METDPIHDFLMKDSNALLVSFPLEGQLLKLVFSTFRFSGKVVFGCFFV